MSKSGKIALIVGGVLVFIELLLFLHYLREKESMVFPKAPIPVEYPIVDYNNSVKGHDERESIVGVFDGKDRDSLYVIPADEIGFGEDEDMQVLWDVKSANGSVPSLRVFGIRPMLVFEGDLDGNGTDEFGILDTWVASALRGYEVYSFHNGEWRWLIPRVRTAESLRASGKELVKPGNRPGEVLVVFSDFDSPLSSYSVAPDKDTVIVATFEKIDPLPI